MAISTTDIFNRKIEIGEPVSADSMRLLVPGLTDEGLLAQSVNVSYEQAITRLYEVGSPKTFFVAGRTRGQLQVRKVIGAKGPATNFIKTYGDVCNMAPNPITLTFNAGCGDSKKVGSIELQGIVINQVAYQVQAQDTMVFEDVTALVAAVKNISQ